MPIVHHRELTVFVDSVVRAVGADEEVAREVARHLVRANLSGHDSHGVIRVPHYVAQIDRGELAPAARPTVVREMGATVLVDAHRCFGHFSTAFALDRVVELAGRHGVASAVVRHSTHIGRLGEYAERAAAAGLILLGTVGAAGSDVGWMPPFGGRGRFVGANPWAIGVPGAASSMIFDGSMTTVAQGKVQVARARGEQLPPGWVVDRDGNPTCDPADLAAGGALTPLGGAVAGHKGYGLGLASALIGGMAVVGDPDPTLVAGAVSERRAETRDWMAGVALVGIDPGAFVDAEAYKRSVEDNLTAARRTAPADGVDEVLAPGDAEERTRRRRESEGIGLPETTWDELSRVAERLDVSLPEHDR